MHGGGSLDKEVVVRAVFSGAQHPDNIGSQCKVIRCRSKPWSEECHQILAPCNVAGYEQVFNGAAYLLGGCIGRVGRLELLEISHGLVVHIEYILRSELSCLIEVNGRIELEEEYVRHRLVLVYLYDIGKTFIQPHVVVLDIVDHVQTEVVVCSRGISRIILRPYLIYHEKGVHKSLAVDSILAVLLDKVTVHYGTVYQHCLVCGRRTKGKSLPPVRNGFIIILLLEIFLIIGKIFDALRAVCTVLALGGKHLTARYHQDG